MAPTRPTEGHGHFKIVKVGWLASSDVVARAHTHIHLAASYVQSNAVRPPVLRRRSMK